MSNGHRLIVSQQKFVARKTQFDPWHEHAVDCSGMNAEPTPTLHYVVSIEFRLVPGDLFYYIWPLFDDIYGAIAKVNEGSNWQNKDARNWGFGEWFNFVGRHEIVEKLTPVEYLAYVSAH